MRQHLILLSAALFFFINNTDAQKVATSEDVLMKDTASILSKTSIGGYGSAFYQNNQNNKTANINLERFVLFIGHKFNKKISLFTELEIEDAKISGGENGGELAIEQCYLKFNIDPNHYFAAGLFIPTIGILNENHLPNSFNGNERNQVETFILPSTWRELGVSFYGVSSRLPISYSLALVNGLNSEAFEHGSVVRGGRYEGRNASANNLAITGALQVYTGNFKSQLSLYYGGSVGLSPRQADSLKLSSGIFGTPVMISEADVQYENNGFAAKLLASIVSIPNASEINRAYANNTPQQAYGYYAELAYNIFEHSQKLKDQNLNVFARYEKLDMNASLPSNGIYDGMLKQEHIVLGVSYLPTKNVALKCDVRLTSTGKQNPDLVVNPSPVSLPYKTNNTLINIGLGFSF